MQIDLKRIGLSYDVTEVNKKIRDLTIKYFDEQNKIATLLHELDKTIALHDQKLSLLKHVKQSLLQNIFI